MALLPRINQMKFGIINQDYMNAIASRSDEFANMEKQLSELVGKASLTSTNGFLAKIDLYGSLAESNSSSNMEIAWSYKFTRIDFKFLPYYLDPDPAVEDEEHSGALYDEKNYVDEKGVNQQTSEEFDQMVEFHQHPRHDDVGTGARQGYCYNLAELSNIISDPIIFGVDVSSDDFDSGFEPQPVPDGSIVRLDRILDTYGHQHYTFDRQGIFDGVCTV